MLAQTSIGMAGCRLSDGRLHLGHYVGCLHPDKLSHVSTVFFVIQDGVENPLTDQARSTTELMLLLSQIISIESSNKIYPCLQSAIFGSYAPIYDFARGVMTRRSLETVHPKRDHLAKKGTLSLRDYLFPIDEAVQFLAFGASYCLMNDDNARFVYLSNRLRQKMSSRFRDIFPKTTVLLKPVPRILGSDARKMSKSNGNAIFFTDKLAIVRERMRDYARRHGWRQTPQGGWAHEGPKDVHELLPTKDPLVALGAAFLSGASPTNPTIQDAPAIVDDIIAVIEPMVSRVQAESSVLLSRPAVLRERLAEGNAKAADRIQELLGRLVV